MKFTLFQCGILQNFVGIMYSADKKGFILRPENSRKSKHPGNFKSPLGKDD